MNETGGGDETATRPVCDPKWGACRKWLDASRKKKIAIHVRSREKQVQAIEMVPILCVLIVST